MGQDKQAVSTDLLFLEGIFSMRCSSVLNFKGGVGKTSLTTKLAHALTLRGAKVPDSAAFRPR
jgi:Mrp family chromosome partitioning ATPase